MWGGLQPIRQQLIYDSCTILGWILATTIFVVVFVVASSVSVSSQTKTTTSGNNDEISKLEKNNSSIISSIEPNHVVDGNNNNSNNSTDGCCSASATVASNSTTTGSDDVVVVALPRQRRLLLWAKLGMMISISVCVGCFVITSQMTVTNRWTMTLPMIPILFFHSCLYYCIVLVIVNGTTIQQPQLHNNQHSDNTAMTTTNTTTTVGRKVFTASMLISSFLCYCCIGTASLLSILFPAVELPSLPPPFQSTSNNSHIDHATTTIHHSIGVMDLYIPLPQPTRNVCPVRANHDSTTTTTTTTNHNYDHIYNNINGDDPTCSVQNDDESLMNHSTSTTTTSSSWHHHHQKYLPPTITTQQQQQQQQQPYAAHDGIASIPYLNVETAIEFCRHCMQFGASAPMKQLDWILHTWRLITLPLHRNAPIAMPESNNNLLSNMPLVVFSHGLGGTMDLYSYQTMSLVATTGCIVVSMTHTDGSAPIVPQPYHPQHQHIPHDTTILQLLRAGKYNEYETARQRQTTIRVQEYIYAVEYVQQLFLAFSSQHNDHTNNSRNSQHHHPNDSEASTRSENHHASDGHLHNHHQPEHHQQMLQKYWHLPRAAPERATATTKQSSPVTTTSPLRTPTFFMGHSFGGATALQAAYERPDLVTAIIAHEPAIGWTSARVCHALFPSSIIMEQHADNDTICSPLDDDGDNLERNETIGNGTTSLHNFDMLILNSQEWMDKNWGRAQSIQELYQQQQFGKNTHLSKHGVIHQSHHNEFSDTSMLTPLWLARPVGLTGSRNPIHTAEEIATLTTDFIQRILRHYHQRE